MNELAKSFSGEDLAPNVDLEPTRKAVADLLDSLQRQ
jgi:hypothetical protein